MENKENGLEGETRIKTRKTETGVCTEAGKEISCRQSDERCLVQKSRAKKKKADEEHFIKTLKIDWGGETANSKQTDDQIIIIKKLFSKSEN